MLYFDNSVVRKATQPSPDPAVTRYVREHRERAWAVPATVAYEYLVFFDDRSERRRQRRRLESNFQEVAPITLDVATEVAELSQLLSEQGLSLDAADLLHAAIARAKAEPSSLPTRRTSINRRFTN